jgi:catechol 2,3-dioxygenase-like lactoylglutathione lyase family enzyme
MIDHISIGVRDLAASREFYLTALAPLGYELRADESATCGFGRHGKPHSEFWLNARPGMAPVPADSGIHICLRAKSPEVVHAFYEAALAKGGTSDGAAGPRPDYSPAYYAAFVRDLDGNRIEVVTFTTG